MRQSVTTINIISSFAVRPGETITFPVVLVGVYGIMVQPPVSFMPITTNTLVGLDSMSQTGHVHQ